MGLAVTALVAAAALVASLPLGHAPAASAVPGPSFYATGTAVTGIAIGRPAPDFVDAGDARRPLLTDLQGNAVKLADFAGRPLWIVFWATWCTPCQQEASDIRAAFHAHRDGGLAVLAIDIREPAAAVRDYASAHDLDYTIGLDPTATVMGLYGGWGLPSHFFVDGLGTLRDRYLGQLNAELMEQHLSSILGS